MSSPLAAFNAGAQRTLRVGVVGAGIMGSNHARVLAGLPRIDLVGIVDPLPAHRARAAEMIGCRTFAGLDDLIAEGVQAGTISAPAHLHPVNWLPRLPPQPPVL